MKRLIIISFYLIIAIFYCIPKSFTQKNSVNFLGHKYTLTKDCKKVSDFEFHCEQFEMSWLKMPKTQIENVLFDQIKKFESQSPDFKFYPILVTVLDSLSNGFLVSFTADSQKYFGLYAAANINNQNVLIQCLDVRPFWKFDDANPIFTEIIKILPQKDRIKMNQNALMPKNQNPLNNNTTE